MEQNLSRFELIQVEHLEGYYFIVEGLRFYLEARKLDIAEIEIFELLLTPFDEDLKGFTNRLKVKNTVVYWIEYLFKQGFNTLCFYCYSEDGKADKRKALFDRWKEENENNDFCEVHTYSIDDVHVYLLVAKHQGHSKEYLNEILASVVKFFITN